MLFSVVFGDSFLENVFAHLITAKTANSIKTETFGKVGRGQSLQLFSGMHFSNINNKK